MTTSDDELVHRLRASKRRGYSNNGVRIEGRAEPPSADELAAADAITRLTRDLAAAIDDGFKVELSRDVLAGKLLEAQAAVASARAQGAEEMREGAAKHHDEQQKLNADIASEIAEGGDPFLADIHMQMAEAHGRDAAAIRALPSPVAVQAVPEGWVEKVRAILLKHEWRFQKDDDLCDSCPECENVSAAGHLRDCAYAEALALLPSPTAGE